MEKRIFENQYEVAVGFTDYLLKAIQSKDSFSIALSGGSTPKVLFEYLAENHKDLEWSKVSLFWGDERCVPPDHLESNYKMTVDHLLSRIKIPAENIHRIHGEKEPNQEAIHYGKHLDQHLPLVSDIPQFDLVILGMGNDGHTASIFPEAIELWDSEENCVVASHPESGQKRVSITGKIINNAKEVAFLVTGAGKKEKVEEIIHKNEKSRRYPATLVAPSSGKLYWFLDKAAAQGLSN